MRRRATAGMTLLEVLIAVTLLTLLVVGMSMAMRISLSTLGRTTDRLMDDRRVAGAQKIILAQLEGLMPVTPPCLGGPKNLNFVFFQAEPQFMRMVSTYSLQQGTRGAPQILEFFIIPGEKNGVRLVVNETPYTPYAAGNFCSGTAQDSTYNVTVPVFPPPPRADEHTFVLADHLAGCKFSYYSSGKDKKNPLAEWYPNATGLGWPLAIRIDMAPLEVDKARMQPVSVEAWIRIFRDPLHKYEE